MNEIHGICEANDSTLFLASAEDGFLKVVTEERTHGIGIKRARRYRFFYKQQEISSFYPLLSTRDSILWLGSRGNGLIRFNTLTNEYRVVSLKELLNKQTDDILSLCHAHNGKLYAGTTSGLVELTIDGPNIEGKYIGREHGLLNDMIHSVLEDDNGILWLGTNRGLAKYNPANGISHNYYYSSGMQVGEFCDDAYHRCPYTGNLFFGGINGLVCLASPTSVDTDTYPDILLRHLWVGQEKQPAANYLSADGNTLTLNGKSVSFTLSFVIPDYQNGTDVEYSTRLEGRDKQWSPFSNLNEVSYTDLPSGKYRLQIRYKKDVFNTEYQMRTIVLHIRPPFYLSAEAYAAYAFLLIVSFACLYRWTSRRLRRKRMQSPRLHREPESVPGVATTSQPPHLPDEWVIIDQACDRLREGSLPPDKQLEQVELIRKTVMAVLKPKIRTNRL